MAGTLKSNTNMWNDTYSYTNVWGKNALLLYH